MSTWLSLSMYSSGIARAALMRASSSLSASSVVGGTISLGTLVLVSDLTFWRVKQHCKFVNLSHNYSELLVA